jgi:hypothetical protein
MPGMRRPRRALCKRTRDGDTFVNRRGDKSVGNRAQHLILMFLMVGPSLSGAGIPIFGLHGVVGVDWVQRTWSSLHGASRDAVQRSRGRAGDGERAS